MLSECFGNGASWLFLLFSFEVKVSDGSFSSVVVEFTVVEFFLGLNRNVV